MQDAPRDPHQPLRDDVRLLGRILGDTVREHAGARAFDAVETVRRHAKAARAGDDDAARELQEFLRGLPLEEAVPVARAFAQFLTLANIAEQHHRVRRRRDYQRDPAAAPQRGSLEDALQALRRQGVPPERIVETIRRMRIELVLTSHPTEITRRTLLAKHQRVAQILELLDHDDLTPRERDDAIEALRREVAMIWRTADFRRERPSPEDEARSGFAVVEHILWDALPRHLRDVDQALRALGDALPLDAAPMRFATWMGGDRDGNPNVTPATTRRVVLLARWMAADLFHREVHALREELSLADAAPFLRERVGDAPEPYRAFLRDVRSRLDGTRRRIEAELEHTQVPDVPAYEATAQLREDLMLCYESLHATGAGAVADGRLLDVLRRLACFGLHFLPLDLRQDAARHAAAMEALARAADDGEYGQWDEPTRVAYLHRRLASPPRPLPMRVDDPQAQDVLDTFREAARLPRDNLGAYVISMARRPSDVLAVEVLQRDAGIEPPLRVVPLFETLDDLQHAEQVVRELLQDETYRERLRGQGLEVMIGYSDSAKDAGLLAAHWNLYRTQEALVAVCRDRDVSLTLFHGRGGTVGRGGAPAHQAILSQPPGSVEGTLRVTEQGEVIQSRFGQPGIALRTLELYTSAVLTATLAPPPPPRQEWRRLMDRMAEAATSGYRGLVRGRDGFVDYFHAATPVEELGGLHIGSRPARREGPTGFEGLRAIPWVFGWTQNRMILPAWLGVGEGLRAAKDAHAWSQVQAMADGWPFFRSFLDMVEMVLAKTDFRIAQAYDDVLVTPALRPIGQEIRRRFDDTVGLVLEATGHEHLLEANPVLRRSIDVRNPYVDPLNLLQVEYLRRQRTRPDEVIRQALLVTLNGVAQGMRNTG